MPQDGKNNTPFATADGKPITPETNNTKPTDFTKDATSDAQKGGSFDVTRQNRQQQTEPPPQTTPMQPHMVNRPQNVGDGPRFNTRSVPADGSLVPPTPTQQPSKGTGSIGVSRSPFKNMK
jgi:hypothetical protein